MKTAKIIGIKELQWKLAAMRDLSAKKDREGVVVGFSQSYAIYVHERQARHKKGKQWKFLEQPTRILVNSGELNRIITETFRATQSLTKSLLVAGLRIQREAMKVTPVLTGALKASAYTAKDSQSEMKARMAFNKSEHIRHRKRVKGEMKGKLTLRPIGSNLGG